MAPRFSMPQGEEAAWSAGITQLRDTVRALRCAAELLLRGTPNPRERAVADQILLAIHRAERAINRLPSRWIP